MAVQAMKAGAVDFIEKPVGHEDLLASVRHALDEMRDTAKLSAWRETAATRVGSLTARQRQILDLVLAGHPSKNIAADLGISQRTVDNHRAAIMRKTSSKSLPALIRTALAADRAAGYRLVLLSGELDLALRPVVAELGFDELVCNRLVFRDGAASGEVVAPLVAESEKAAAIRRLCQMHGTVPTLARAYSDSLSDLPMLEAVGQPFAVNPEGRLRRVALARGWPILDWRKA